MQAFASDPNTADIVTLSLADDAGGRFSIGTNGKIYVANGVALDFETQPSWDVTVRATDAAGAFTDSVFAISLNNVAGDTPTDSDGAANSVIEGAANGTYTGLTGSLVSPTGSPVTYSLISNAFGRFQINSTTGAVTVANGALLDFETQSAWNITVGATDGKITGSKVFTINLVDVAGDTPTDSDGAANSVIEGAANGTYTGLTGSLVSPTGSPVTYSLISSAFGRFQINSTTGAVTVANGALLDFETQSAWNITVGATDGKITGSKVFTINLVNGNDAPGTVSDTDGADNIVNEGAAVGTVVGIAAQAIDPNGDLLTYSLVNNAGGRFAINASTGVITVANGALLDFESQSAWDVTVRATDGGGLYSEQLFTIDIADIVWDTLVDSDLATNDIVDENAATDTYTGVTAAAVSPSGEPVTYSLTDNAAGRFQIDASTGAIAVLDGNLLDFEAQNAWNVTVSASDGSTAHEQVFTIYLNDQASESWFGTSEDDIFTINRLGEWVLNGLGGNDVLTATDGQHITFIGGDGNDTLTGRNGNDVFQYDGTANGLDAVVGGDGYDVIQAIAGNTTIGLSAVSGIEEINGGGFADVILQLGAGNDVIDSNVTALTGIATIRAGAGNDSIIGTSADESIFGEDGNDLILGGGGGDALNGGNGVDTVSYAGSWDALTINLATNAVSGGDATGDTITGFENVTGSDFNDSITGSTGANVISAGAGNDTLDGGAGADTLVGGLGNDTYTVDNAGDVVTENASEGTDTVQTGLASYTLGTNVENLVYTGTTAFTGTGNTLNNALTGGAGNDTLSGGDGNDTLTGLGGSDTLNGGAGNDTLNGGAGTDTLVGGLGDDIYVVDVATDIVTEAANAGTDTVQTGLASYTLGTNVENLVYTGTAAFTGTGNTLNNAITGGVGNDTLSGGDGNDTLNGGAGNDTLNGGAGTDTLVGGLGDDIYVVDVATDIVTEGLNQGTDTVQTGLASYTLGANVENLVYTGTVAFTGTGNALNNAITGGAGNDTLSGGDGNDTLNGGAGNDTLNGGAGTDTLVGGLGDDIYVVDVATDIVTEAANAGTDTVQTGLASYTLGTNVENLVYTGTVAFTGTGNALNNAITGGAGNDTLDGGAGTDTLAGGAGNDTYVVDVATDIVTEAANAGTDTVRTGLVSYTLGTNVENLVYTGTAAFTGTGNALNNAITGGAGNDILSGGAGNDTINGGAGNDTLEGGAGSDTLDGGTGNDRFVYSAAGFGSDSISGFAGGTGIGDVLSFRTSVFADWQALLSKSAQVGSDTVITLNTLDKVTLKNFALSNFKSDDATFYT
ncbi:cadherin domain-containing protein [Burkholderia sp.]|uniref:beta strand repeat-containing protein n=1 Tax=Burkholderia sp. TaxID=36773 RepID=UPI00258641BE|nr:cadherin domain-containing protein [Burkholderia sp.]